MKLAVEFGFVLVNGGRDAICGVGVPFGAEPLVFWLRAEPVPVGMAIPPAGAGIRGF